MIEAIVFDCFGVLAVDGWLPFKQRHFANRPELQAHVSELNRQTDAGLLPYEDFLNEVAELAGVTVAQFRADIEQTVVHQELLGFIRDELKPHYRIGMLSNVAGHWLERKFSPAQRQLFDAITLSSDTGFVKPDPRAYQVVLAQLGVDAAAAILVDDREGNCTGARDVGMQAIHYQSLASFQAQLTEVITQA